MSNYEEYEVKLKNGEVRLLSDIIKSHTDWLSTNGRCGEQADLTDVYIAGIDFPDDTAFDGAILERIELVDVNMTFASFYGCNCHQATFRRCYLRESTFMKANLDQCIFSNTVIKGTDFYDSNLTNSSFNDCYLCHMHCDGSILKGSTFTDNRMHHITFEGAVDIPDLPMACPREGSFIAWKKVKNDEGEYLIKLEIPADAERSSATSKKCRCSKAKVLGIYDYNMQLLPLRLVVNKNYKTTVYEVGTYVFPDVFDPYRWNECSNGIHFFVDFEDAKNYRL